MKADGPPGASAQRLQREPRAVQLRQVRHVDRRDGRRRPSSPIRRTSTVADKVGFALAPDNGLGKRGNWLWAWSLAVPAGSQKVDAAEKFIAWATSQALHRARRCARKAGPTFLRAPAPRSTRTRTTRRCSVRQDDARLDQLGRSDSSDRQAGSLRRRAVRRHPRVRRASAPKSARTSRPRSPAR